MLLFQKLELAGTVGLKNKGKGGGWGKINGGDVTVRVNAKNFYCDSNNIGHLWVVDLSDEGDS